MGGTSSAAPQSPPLPPWHAKIFMTRVSVIRSHSWFANSLDASRPCCCFLTAAQPREVSAGHFKSWNPEPMAAVLQLAGLSCVRPGYPAARSTLAPVRKVSRRRVGRDLQATVFALRPTATWHRCHLAKNCGVRPKAPLRWRSSCRTLPRRGRVFSLRQRTSFGHRQPAGTSPPRRNQPPAPPQFHPCSVRPCRGRRSGPEAFRCADVRDDVSGLGATGSVAVWLVAKERPDGARPIRKQLWHRASQTQGVGLGREPEKEFWRRGGAGVGRHRFVASRRKAVESSDE